MRTILLSLFIFFSALASAQSKITYDKESADVGLVIIEVDSLGREHKSTYQTVEIKFQNTGNEPLVINSVNGNGNAFAEFPKDPILPGKGGTIKVTVYKFRYDKPMDKDGQHSFCTCVTVRGNYPGEDSQLCVRGMTKRVRKK